MKICNKFPTQLLFKVPHHVSLQFSAIVSNPKHAGILKAQQIIELTPLKRRKESSSLNHNATCTILEIENQWLLEIVPPIVTAERGRQLPTAATGMERPTTHIILLI